MVLLSFIRTAVTLIHRRARNCSTSVVTGIATDTGASKPPGKRRRGLYAGTFDPPSVGHQDIIRRALELVDELVVAVALNPSKKPMFAVDERTHLLREMVRIDMPDRCKDVEIAAFDGLIVDFAKERSVSFLVRGLRAYSDFEYEFRMALINRRLTGVETCFLMAAESNSHISSSLIRDLARWKKTLPGFVPESIAAPVYAKLGVPYSIA